MNLQPENLAEAFPVGEHLKEELNARGWTTKDLAMRIGGTPREIGINILAYDMLIAAPEARIDRPMAEDLSRAMDVSAELFLNLDESYHRWATAKGIEKKIKGEENR